MKIPLFFKIWFAFCAALALGVLGFQVWAVYTVASHPEVIGKAVGKVQKGYEQETK